MLLTLLLVPVLARLLTPYVLPPPLSLLPLLLLFSQDIVGLLAALLNRPHAELLLLAVGFLRRLCVFAVSETIRLAYCHSWHNVIYVVCR
jgi:hypothetical protein